LGLGKLGLGKLGLGKLGLGKLGHLGQTLETISAPSVSPTVSSTTW
jgi:hypothetical protein